ncbi:Inosose dehydratase [Rubripirellula obstinata]|uniref:Inosose dehydratase n=2 Tax=Rubripirellula obstinata TaxID=406547 RepID=A0A5B1CPZ5_9BACT|nr:Inosose dehydratase [Rubripirellula obstinata]
MTALGAAAGGATASISVPNWLHAMDPDNRYRQQIGIQLYTLRNEIKQDVKATLKAVAEAGFYQVEPYGFPNCRPMIEAASEFGLKLNSSHFNSDSIVNNDTGDDDAFDTVLEKANDVGLSHLVIPYLPDTFRTSLDDYKRVCENCNRAAEKAKDAGIQLSYHNHAFEFKPIGKEEDAEPNCGYEIMINEFSPDMKFEVDVFWVVVGGEDPAELINRLGSRVSQLHLKDLNKATKLPSYDGVSVDAFEEIGDGIIDMEPIIEAAEKAGVEHCHIEQDQSPDALASVQQSIAYLKSM